jgi:hypothetical protein
MPPKEDPKVVKEERKKSIIGKWQDEKEFKANAKTRLKEVLEKPSAPDAKGAPAKDAKPAAKDAPVAVAPVKSDKEMKASMQLSRDQCKLYMELCAKIPKDGDFWIEDKDFEDIWSKAPKTEVDGKKVETVSRNALKEYTLGYYYETK